MLQQTPTAAGSILEFESGARDHDHNYLVPCSVFSLFTSYKFWGNRPWGLGRLEHSQEWTARKDSQKGLVPRPRLVPPDKWDEYEVDHANANTLDNRLANLEPMQRDRHREKRRPRLKHAQKVRMVGDLKKKPAANGVMMKYTVATS